MEPPSSENPWGERYIRIQRPKVKTRVRYDEFLRRYYPDYKDAKHRQAYPDDPNRR